MPLRARPALTAVLLLALLLAACSGSHSASPPGASAGSTSTAPPSATGAVPGGSGSVPPPAAVRTAPLAAGERWVDVPMPGGSYRPQAPAGATDDYRCILLDPKLTRTAFLSGAVLEPGNPKLVHHAILYRLAPDQVRTAEAADAADPRLGWSCFGDVGIRRPGVASTLGFLDAAPWVAAWAATGGEQRFPKGTGEQLAAGSRLVLQLHYNLLHGGGVDDTEIRLRVASANAHLKPLRTQLLPAPVELPCTGGQKGLLCDRSMALLDLQHRFGAQAGATVAGLQLLCGGDVSNPRAGPVQSCTRPVAQRMQIRAVAGHMHLLGRSVRIELLHPGSRPRTLLDVKTWNFDDQHATVLPAAVDAGPGDQLRVTCRHDARLRDLLPELRTLPSRYVMWGEGTADEMCLGIVEYTT